jgi:prepilin-type N-terminal cleavage/methylation domain-containing protein
MNMKRTRAQLYIYNCRLNLSGLYATRPSRRAFSLAELMVAVGILGIGMIMVAMAFPVALDQSRQAAELATSKLVYNDAVNTLKTRVKWTELERYIEDVGNSGSNLDLSKSPTDPPNIVVIDFSRNDGGGNHYFPNFYNGTTFQADNLVYSADNTNTYGWVAAAQKINNQTYKFWIFVLREPTGILDDAGNFKIGLRGINNLIALCFDTYPAGTDTNVLRFQTNNLPNRPDKGVPFLANNGQMYRVVDVGEEEGSFQKAKCDKRVSDGIPDANLGNTMIDVAAIAYPVAQAGARVTRKNPVLTVYQTVISY